MKTAETLSSGLIDALFDEITPQELRRTERRMLIAAKIEDGLNAKGWSKGELAKRLGYKGSSIVTKWLSGTNNFTSDLLSDLEEVLEIRLLDVEEAECGPQVERYNLSILSEMRTSRLEVRRPIVEVGQGISHLMFELGGTGWGKPAMA